jgi:Flp pilus assembly protein TadG
MHQLTANLFSSSGQGRRRAQRRGTTIVETAVVMPIFFLLVFFIIEFGHAMMVSNVLKNAARTSARWGSVGTSSSEDVRDYALARVGSSVRHDRVQIMIKDASALDNGGTAPRTLKDFEDMPNIELANADRQQLFMVRAIVRYGDIALVPNPWLKDVWIGGQTFTRHE